MAVYDARNYLLKIVFSTKGLEDYLYWQRNDKKILKRMNTCLEDIRRNPDEGLGKRKRLKENLLGYFSRRITAEHNLVYMMKNDRTIVVQDRCHY